MPLKGKQLSQFIIDTVRQCASEVNTTTRYREPLVGFASAGDPRFDALDSLIGALHQLPQDLLPSARTVVSFFLPFEQRVVEANAKDREVVAREWAQAYVETNALIGDICAHLIELLSSQGIQAAAEPATGNFDRQTLTSPWSHKSVAVIAGLGSFGLHHMAITEAGCAGRFGSLVISADLPVDAPEMVERCLFYKDGSCLECVQRCPVGALHEDGSIDKVRCWERCLQMAGGFQHMGTADVCGKCAVGPCALESPT
jgi:epoxyqueuosine reductase